MSLSTGYIGTADETGGMSSVGFTTTQWLNATPKGYMQPMKSVKGESFIQPI